MQPIYSSSFLLRPFDDSDAASFAQAVRESVDSVGRWLPWCHAAYSEQDALTWFAVCREGERTGGAYEFGVFSPDGARLYGGAGLNQFNKLQACCNLGYWVRQSRQRQGIASGLVKAICAYGFASLELHRIEIVVAVGNEPSAGVAVKSGAVFECVARNRLLIRGVPSAAKVFSIIPGQSGG